MKGVILSLSIISIVTVGLCLYFSQKPVEAVKDTPVSVVYTPEALVTILNRIRAENGSKPLKLDTRLNQSAQVKADDMAVTMSYGHVDKNGKHGYEYAKEQAPECITVSENLTGTKPGENPFDNWLPSKIHHEAQINTKYDNVGFGRAVDTTTNLIYVVHFCDV